MSTQTFKHTKKALEAYDAGAAARKRAWDSVDDPGDVAAAQKLEEFHLRQVQQAFFQDTKGTNSLDRCLIATIDYMRNCVERWRG